MLEFWFSIGSIILIDIILSGDNAVVIALASKNLPKDKRKKAILWGTGGAVLLRIVFTFIAAWLLTIPYLQFVGGILLLWIAVKLLADDGKDKHQEEASNMAEAIKIIIFADAIMSLDNVLAIAGIARGHFETLVFGVLVSIPLVVWGSQVLLKLMDRWPVIIYIGAAVLGYAAAEMLIVDKALSYLVLPYAVLLKVGLPILVIVLGYLWKRKSCTA